MYKYFFACLILFVLTEVYSQSSQGRGSGQLASLIKGNVSGTVIDSVDNSAVGYAVVELLSSNDQRLVNGTITDGRGEFSIRDVENGNYKLRISFLGYENRVLQDVELTPQRPDVNLGMILLRPSDFMLNEVQIIDQRSAIESRVDRIVFNASADPTLVGGDATDVLSKVPMLSVDMDGNVSLRGSSSVRILLNGKPSSLFSEDVGDALQMFPADEIDKVEVITSPGARYDAEGSAGIINIITKKSIMTGISGSFRSFISNRMQNGSGSIAVGRGRFGMNANLGFRYRNPSQSSVEFYRETYSGQQTNTLTQLGESRTSRGGFRGVIGAFYDYNSYNSFNTNLSLRGWGMFNEGDQNTLFSDPSNNYIRSSTGDRTNVSYSWTTDYTRRFAGNEDRRFILAFQAEGQQTNNDNTKSISTLPFTETNINEGINTELTLQADYIHPFSKDIKIETGAKTILRELDSDFARHYFTGEGNDSLDLNNSDVFSYNQNVFAAYLSGTFQLPGQITIMPGLRYENTFLKGSFERFESPFQNSYDNWFPSISVSKRFKDFSSLRVSFDRRLSRPSINYINPFIDNEDPLNISFGNPGLAPEISSNHEISYSKFMKGATVNLSLFYRNTRDIIESFLFIDDNNISNTTFYNIGNTKALGFNIFSNVTLFKIWQVRGNFTLNKFFINASNLDEGLNNEGFRYNAFVSSNVRLKNGWHLELWGFFNSPRIAVQGKTPAFYMYRFGIQKDIFNKRAQIGLRIAHPFSETRDFVTELSGPTFIQTNKVSVPFRSYGLYFSYNFGSLEFKERKSIIDNQDQKLNGSGDDMDSQ